MQGQQIMFFEREEVLRRILIIAEAVSKLPSTVMVSFNVNLNILDKKVKDTIDDIDRKTNSAYQAPFKLQILDDTKGVADNLLSQMGFSTETKEPGAPKSIPPLPSPPPPESGNTFRFSSDDPSPQPPDA